MADRDRDPQTRQLPKKRSMTKIPTMQRRQFLAAAPAGLAAAGMPTAAAQMVRIHRGESGVGPCLESGVDHRLDGVALGR
jgi:hypothetical protein